MAYVQTIEREQRTSVPGRVAPGAALERRRNEAEVVEWGAVSMCAIDFSYPASATPYTDTQRTCEIERDGDREKLIPTFIRREGFRRSSAAGPRREPSVRDGPSESFVAQQ